jgi:hypothetical protein
MKKLVYLNAKRFVRGVLTAVVFAFAAGAAFAQITVSGNAKSFWIPYKLTVPQDITDDNPVLHQTAVQVPWGGPDLSAGFHVSGWSEYAGFDLGADISYGTGNRASNPFSVKAGHSFVWIRPIEQVKLTLGVPYDDSLQGKIKSSDFASYVLDNRYTHNQSRLEYGDGQYNIFTRVNPYAWGNADYGPTANLAWPEIAAAAQLNVNPIDGLSIIAFFAPEAFIGDGSWTTIVGSSVREDASSANGEQLSDVAGDQDMYDAAQVYKNLQLAVGYDIPNFGLVRAQYIGFRSTIELAAEVKVIPFVSLDVGLKIPFEGIGAKKPGADVPVNESYMYKAKKDFQFSVGANFQYADFSLMGRVDTAFAGSDSSPNNVFSGTKVATRGLDLLIYLMPTYNLGFATLGGDIAFEYEAEDDFTKAESNYKTGNTDGLGAGIKAGFGVWLEKKFGPGTIKGGIVTRLPTNWHSQKLPAEVFIPVMVSVGF